MKIRKQFVSNSSSSSFTCEVCNNTESGWDLCLSEAEMVECTEGHLICEDHISRDLINILNDEDREDWYEDWRHELKPEHCPICSFTDVDDESLIRYLLFKLEMSRNHAVDEMREKYGNLSEFDSQMQLEDN